jgi:uncharacterized protein YndB with AHSA1/START domain
MAKLEMQGNVVVLERTFDAPRELVFAAWTEPERLAQWWGPKMFTNPVCRVDARAGGEIYVEMTGSDGAVYPMTGSFIEVKSPEKLVFTTMALNRVGKVLFEVLHRVEFREEGAKTFVRVESGPTMMTPEAAPYLKGHATGYSQSLDKLDEVLAGGRQMIATRVFDAPRDLVYSMFIDPEHLSNWWGPRGFRTTTIAMDARPGGEWVHTMRGPDGRDYPNKVVYVEVARPERLVYDHVSKPLFRGSAVFTEKDGKTEVKFSIEFASAEMCEQIGKEFGAVRGQIDTLDRLAEALETMRQNC